MSDRSGYTIVRVLPDLEGKPWNEITRAYLRALRADVVRVIEHGAGEKIDAWCWRVTVYLTEAGNIDVIQQEVEVDLPDGVEHGHDLNCRLVKL